jgi:hypothetical protein
VKQLQLWTLLFLFSIVMGSQCVGQTFQAEALGTVTDESGATLLNAEVTVTSLEKGFKRTTTSDDRGFYTVPNLDPGDYRLEIMMQGFSRFVLERLRLDSRVQVRVDAKLIVGQVKEQIVVEGRTPGNRYREPENLRHSRIQNDPGCNHGWARCQQLVPAHARRI